MEDKSPTGLKGNSKKYNIRVKYKGNTIKTWIFLSKFLFYTQKKIFKPPTIKSWPRHCLFQYHNLKLYYFTSNPDEISFIF